MSSNPGLEGLLKESMSERVPEEMRDLLKTFGLPKTATLGLLVEHMRVSTHRVGAERIQNYLKSFPGWTIQIEDDDATIHHGDRIGTIEIKGKSVPAYAYMGITGSFDRTDPPLEKLFQQVGRGRKTAIVLHLIPRFDLLTDADGNIRQILLHGGWHYTDGVWSPFVISPLGPDDIPDQVRYLKPGQPSRGLLRDRGLHGNLLKPIRTFFESFDNAMQEALGKDRRSELNIRLATHPDGWSVFVNDGAAQAQDELFSSLNTAKPAPPRTDLEEIEDITDLVPTPILDVVDIISKDRDEAQELLRFLAILTDGFAGLDDENCANITPLRLNEIIGCSSAQVSTQEIAGVLESGFGWTIKDVGGDAPGRREGLVGHNTFLAHIQIPGHAEPVPVFFFGGHINPTEASDNYAFYLSRLCVRAMTEDGPALLLPASVNLRGAPGEPAISDNGIPKRLLIMAGYAFDGSDWIPVSFGEPGSDPFRNRLNPQTLEPETEACYTGQIDLDGKTISPLAPTIELQMIIDRHHDLGPHGKIPRDFDFKTDYSMQFWDKDWFFFLDHKQNEVYPG